MQLYLIRHGQSFNNARPVEERVEDPGLTEVGTEQASLLAEWAVSLQLTRLITSPFLRTLETARPISEATGLTAEVRVPLHEQGGCVRGATPQEMVGRPGMTDREIQARFPAFRVCPTINAEGWWKSMPFESLEAAAERAARLFDQTRSEFGQSDQRVAYVMHGDFKRLLLARLHPGPLETPYNASASRILLTSESAILQQYNRVDHLPAGLLTR